MNGFSGPYSVCLFLLFVAACDAIPTLVHQQLSKNSIDGDLAITEYSDSSRKVRSITAVARAIQKSLQTWQTILNKARPVPPKGKVKQYVTKGDYGKAVQDFESLEPIDVTNFIVPEVNGVGMRGRVGEWTFIVKDKGHGGQPTIEALKTDLSSGFLKIRKTDVLMYFD